MKEETLENLAEGLPPELDRVACAYVAALLDVRQRERKGQPTKAATALLARVGAELYRQVRRTAADDAGDE